MDLTPKKKNSVYGVAIPVFEREFPQFAETPVVESFKCALRKSQSVSIFGILFATKNRLCFANLNYSWLKIDHRLIIDMRSITIIHQIKKNHISINKGSQKRAY